VREGVRAQDPSMTGAGKARYRVAGASLAAT
jgi:hypothetical protein